MQRGYPHRDDFVFRLSRAMADNVEDTKETTTTGGLPPWLTPFAPSATASGGSPRTTRRSSTSTRARRAGRRRASTNAAPTRACRSDLERVPGGRPAAQWTRQPRPGGKPTCTSPPGRTIVGTTPLLLV